MAGEPRIAPEVAESDFARMCAARRLETDGAWSKETKEAFEGARQRICRYIANGDVTIDGNGDPCFKFGEPPIKLGKVTGRALLEMDGKEDTARAFAGLAVISGMAASHFSNFDLADIRMLEDFFLLFFGRR